MRNRVRTNKTNRHRVGAGFEFVSRDVRNNNSLFYPESDAVSSPRRQNQPNLQRPLKPGESDAHVTTRLATSQTNGVYQTRGTCKRTSRRRSFTTRTTNPSLLFVDGHHPHERKQKAEGDCVSGAPIKDCRYFRAKPFLSPAPLRP